MAVYSIGSPPFVVTEGSLKPKAQRLPIGQPLYEVTSNGVRLWLWNGSEWALDEAASSGSSVQSVFGRTGDVNAQSGDYSFSLISGSIGDGQVPQSAVTQHEGALSISESQVSGLGTAALADTGTGSNDVPLNSDLGTAAYEDVTTSNTDTTSGRVTRVGDFGLGEANTKTYDDLNNAGDITQFFTADSGAANSPFAAVGVGLNVSRIADRNIQLLGQSAGSDPLLYYREQGGGDAWTDWVEIYHTGNLESANLDWTGDHTFDNAISFTGNSGTLDYDEDTVELGGDFDAGEEVKCVRIGSQVTITLMTTGNHASSSNPVSSLGAIPSQYRPPSTMQTVYDSDGFSIYTVRVTSGGELTLEYKDYSGSDDTWSGTSKFTITYNV